jgi:hypothetical protein
MKIHTSLSLPTFPPSELAMKFATRAGHRDAIRDIFDRVKIAAVPSAQTAQMIADAESNGCRIKYRIARSLLLPSLFPVFLFLFFFSFLFFLFSFHFPQNAHKNLFRLSAYGERSNSSKQRFAACFQLNHFKHRLTQTDRVAR